MISDFLVILISKQEKKSKIAWISFLSSIFYFENDNKLRWKTYKTAIWSINYFIIYDLALITWTFAQANIMVFSITISSYSTNGRVRRAHFSHRKDHLCLSRAFYFTFFAVPLNTPRWTRLRIQVRRSTYVRLGFRRSESPPTSPGFCRV